jgi:hypothetical protein
MKVKTNLRAGYRVTRLAAATLTVNTSVATPKVITYSYAISLTRCAGV